jgi:hypothetical protein
MVDRIERVEGVKELSRRNGDQFKGGSGRLGNEARLKHVKQILGRLNYICRGMWREQSLDPPSR